MELKRMHAKEGRRAMDGAMQMLRGGPRRLGTRSGESGLDHLIVLVGQLRDYKVQVDVNLV
ncbi:hypothetical protein E5D57_000102 [Metarhizium anisopliae]|nr:hypothetical protein E5D57_000102 [Metarhizium anisopliae]